ncbi:hypothetical protein DFQ27_006876 [Actinomortierella ambigua]|uniref:Uncharacterized protein n=1 Tax=Actinomortierella ambigua TaxID=1343610 RepID=A0A9P6QJ25_9FUNG|nr:hypothetical protein DFQ27_006876 [Actinomortierella ambigua]
MIRSPPFPAANTFDSFEQAWSQHPQLPHPAPGDLIDPSEGYRRFAQLHHHRQPHFEQAYPTFHFTPSPSKQHNNHGHQDTFDKAWQQCAAAASETMAITPAAHVQPLTAGQTQALHPFRPATIPTTAADGSTLLTDFQTFIYQPETTPATLIAPGGESSHGTQGEASLEQAWGQAIATTANDASSWAQEMQQQEQHTDSEDEFSQDWSNEAFTTAYIAANRAHFDQIQARDDEREQRRLEIQEREKQLKRRTCPLVTTRHPSDCNCTGQASSMATPGGPADQDEQHLLLYKEFMRFNKDPNSASLLSNTGGHHNHDHHHQGQAATWASEFAAAAATLGTSISPIRHTDGFESMAADLDEAAMLYHPAAKSRVTPQDLANNQQAVLPEPMPPSGSGDAWVHEFASPSTHISSMDSSHSPSSQTQQRAPEWHRYLGEWDWQSMFGKATAPLTTATTHASGELRHAKDPQSLVLEHQRLQAVALSRLAALFGHLSMQTGGSK